MDKRQVLPVSFQESLPLLGRIILIVLGPRPPSRGLFAVHLSWGGLGVLLGEGGAHEGRGSLRQSLPTCMEGEITSHERTLHKNRYTYARAHTHTHTHTHILKGFLYYLGSSWDLTSSSYQTWDVHTRQLKNGLLV